MDSIIILALSATTVAKTGVDLVRLGVDTPRWLPPALATVIGVGAVLLLMVATSVALDAAAIASAVLAGILAAGGAVGVTELSRQAEVAKGQRRGG